MDTAFASGRFVRGLTPRSKATSIANRRPQETEIAHMNEDVVAAIAADKTKAAICVEKLDAALLAVLFMPATPPVGCSGRGIISVPAVREYAL